MSGFDPAEAMRMTQDELWRAAQEIPLSDLPQVVRDLAAHEIALKEAGEADGDETGPPRKLAMILMALHGPEHVAVYPQAIYVDLEGER